MIYYFLVLIGAYLFGSFPSAFILLKIFQKKDIRLEGSGNVGALNALRSSQSKPLAAVVLLFDLVKGWLPAQLVVTYFTRDFIMIAVVVAGVLIGHIFPVWLKFHGDRVLAVTAGAFIAVSPLLLAIWITIWIVFYIPIRQHIIANLISTFLLPIIVFFAVDSIFPENLLIIILPACFIIFIKHLERLSDIINRART